MYHVRRLYGDSVRMLYYGETEQGKNGEFLFLIYKAPDLKSTHFRSSPNFFSLFIFNSFATFTFCTRNIYILLYIYILYPLSGL